MSRLEEMKAEKKAWLLDNQKTWIHKKEHPTEEKKEEYDGFFEKDLNIFDEHFEEEEHENQFMKNIF